jgi:hypothetical protein
MVGNLGFLPRFNSGGHPGECRSRRTVKDFMNPTDKNPARWKETGWYPVFRTK